MISSSKIALISPIEQNKSTIAWDKKFHKRYFELEAIQMVKAWRKNAGWLKNIDIVFFNVNNANISNGTKKELLDMNCQLINCCNGEDGIRKDYQDLGFLTEPICGKYAEDLLESKDILIKIDLDMQNIVPLDEKLIELAYENTLIEQYTDYDKKGQRVSIGKFNPFDTCFIISNRKTNFYHTYLDLCNSRQILENPDWIKQKEENGNYFIEEFVIDYMFKNKIGFRNILPMQNHIFGEGYKPVELMEDSEIEKIRFLHSHIYLSEPCPNLEYDQTKQMQKYMIRKSKILVKSRKNDSNDESLDSLQKILKSYIKKPNVIDQNKSITKQFVEQESNPLNMLAFIVDRCNYKCEYCYNKMPRRNAFADLDLLLKFIGDVRIKQPASRKLNVSLIGGEPTLHPKLLSFCDQLQKLDNVSVEILTNFSKPVQYYIDILERGICIAASWHSQTNDKLNWDYVKKMKQIPMKYFANNQIEVRIMMENDNWENSKKVFFELYPLYKKYVEISLLTKDNGTPYEYTEKQLNEYNKLIILTKYKREFFTIEYDDKSRKQVSFEDIYLNPLVNFHLWKCNAGLDYIYVHCNGNVYNCQSYYEHDRKPICNIIQTQGEYKKELFKPTICSVDYCSCDFDVYKEKILNTK